MKLTEFFLKRPTLFWSLMVAILLAGIISFFQMPKLEDPAIPIKQCNVVVVYPGATAHEVELQVAQTMEDQLRTLPNVKKIKSDCTPGVCQLTVEFKETVLMDQIEQHFDLLRRKVNDVRAQLPQGCYDPIVIDDMMDVYGMFYALTSDGFDYPEMLRYAKKLRREILTVKGVKRVVIAGDRKEVINITLSKDKIARNGLLPTQMMAVLQDACKTIDGNKYEVDDQRLAVRLSGRVKDEADVRDILVKTIDGKLLRIGDIADVERGFQEPQTYGFFMDGQPAIALCISMDNGVIVPDVGKAVDEKIAQTIKDFPIGLGLQKVFFQPDKVDEAISSFMVNLLESVLIVIIALIFTMGFRSGLIIGAGLVLTIAGSFPILLMCGTTLQRISLGAFIVAMGMLVDNAIVVIDGILVDRQRGLGPRTYLTRICRATAMPLLGATVIAASAFLCIFLSPDTAGEYSRDLFLVLFISLLVSWVLALTQVPMFTKYMLPLHVNAQQHEVVDNRMQKVARRIITTLIDWKRTTVCVAIAALVLSGLLMGKVKNLFFPDFSYKQFVVEYFAPEQTSPDQVRQDLLRMSEIVRQNPNVTSVAASMGSTPALYCLVRPMTAGGDCYGELVIDCPDYETVCQELPKIRKQLRDLYPDGYIRARKYNFSIQTSHTVEVAFSGPDPEVLKRLAGQAEDIMRRCKYVDPQSVQNDWRPMGKSVSLKYAETDARRAGINRSDIGNAIQAVGDGMTCGVINDQDNQVLINFRVRNADGSKIQDISDIPAWTQMNVNTDAISPAKAMMGGKAIAQMMDDAVKAAPLSSVTRDNNVGWEEQLIRRVNGQRHIEAECDPDFEQADATPNKVQQSIQADINAIELPEGYTMRWIGEQEAQSSSNDSLIKYSPLTMFIILGIMLLLFGRWKKVILILMCFPFVLCGIAPALFLTGSPFTFMAIIGFMGLMGMMVKNGIVLVDEITRLTEEEGLHPYQAVVNATVSRTRPVIMASLTTILGMLPLITDPMYSAMAVTIMSGLAMGTIITLALLPLFYTAFYHISKPVPPSTPLPSEGRGQGWGHSLKRMKFLLIVLFSIVVCFSAQAQSSEPIRLTQTLCHELAVKNSEDVKKQQNALQQALLDKKTAFASYLPDIDGSVLAVLMKDTKITDAMSLQMRGTYMAGVSLTLPLYTGGKITTANRLAKVGVEVQSIQQERTRQEVICEADRAYFTYQAVRSKVAMLKAYMQQMDSLCASVSRSVDVSMATRSDLLRIEAKRSQVEYNLKKARNGVQLCRMSLCAALGLDLSTEIEVEDVSAEANSIPADAPTRSLSLFTLHSSLIETRPEYRLLEKNVKAKQLAVRQARADMLPTLALSAQYSKYGWAYMKGEQDGYSYKTEISGNSPVLMATLTVPLWHWGKELNKVKRAKLDYANAQLDLQKNTRLLAIENQQALQNLQDSRQMITTAQAGMSQSEDNLRNLRLRYDNAMATLTDLLDAYSQWQEARSNLIEAQTQYKIYETEYFRVHGLL